MAHENEMMNNDSSMTDRKDDKVKFQVNNKCADPSKSLQGVSIKENYNIPRIDKYNEDKIS